MKIYTVNWIDGGEHYADNVEGENIKKALKTFYRDYGDVTVSGINFRGIVK